MSIPTQIDRPEEVLQDDDGNRRKRALKKTNKPKRKTSNQSIMEEDSTFSTIRNLGKEATMSIPTQIDGPTNHNSDEQVRKWALRKMDRQKNIDDIMEEKYAFSTSRLLGKEATMSIPTQIDRTEEVSRDDDGHRR